MTKTQSGSPGRSPGDLLPIRNAASVFGEATASAVPIACVRAGSQPAIELTPAQLAWAETVGFTGAAKKQALIADPEGRIAAVLLGAGHGEAGEPCGPSELLLGQLAPVLPKATYALAGPLTDPELAAIAWGLGAYRFRRYKAAKPAKMVETGEKGDTQADEAAARLVIPAEANSARVHNTVEAIWLARDLINTPASDLGPTDIETTVREVARRHGAQVTSVIGDDLLQQNFPMIHAVGRASPRQPRLIDLRWQKAGGRKDAPRVTLVGKGITFDTGGLDLKPSSAMLLMKKDMGGAAAALALAHMIMGQGLDVRLRLLIASAENSVSGDAFRPGDVLTSRAGLTVEIGNTDAEGRLVLADALSLADEESPESIFVFATLTGAARTALGPDVPAMFTDNDALAAALTATGMRIGDPVWRLPLWPGYDRHLDSDTADINNVWETPFAGSITAALFLKRFVKNAGRFTHFDLYGWRPAPRPLGPKGGEAQTARTVLEVLRSEVEV